MKINWLKLDVGILDDEKIRLIRKHPDGNALFVLWVGLLCLAMKSDHAGYIEVSDGIPYSVEDLAMLFDIEHKTVQLGLVLFQKYKMVEVFEGGAIEIINFMRHQAIDKIERTRELTKDRMKKMREKRKCDALVTRNAVTSDATDIDIEKEKEVVEGKTFSFDSIEYELSEFLLNLILDRRPNLKKPDLQKWAKDVDLMIRRDGRSPDDIEAVIEWCQQDLFWQNNILSTKKLRDQFDQLCLKMPKAPPQRPDDYFATMEKTA